MTRKDDIEVVNRKCSLAIKENGARLPITNWLNNCGDDCDPDDAVIAVAGPDDGGKWYTIDLREFESAFLN